MDGADLTRGQMRRALCLTLLLLTTACSQPSAGVDWYQYVAIESGIGRLRAERAPVDAPLSPDLISVNFRRIAFDLEPDPLRTGEQVADEPPIIRKWRAPIFYSLLSTDDDEGVIAPKVGAFAKRLREVTGHEIEPLDEDRDGDGSLRLMIVYGSDQMMELMSEPSNIYRKDWSDSEKGVATWIAESIAEWRFAPSPCAGFVLVDQDDAGNSTGEILVALVLIRKEVPDLLLRACIEEELAQVMGTMNDHDQVRPSVFNDDQEFALLTEHDMALLRLLYDPRIEPGMSPDQAMPIVRQILESGAVPLQLK